MCGQATAWAKQCELEKVFDFGSVGKYNQGMVKEIVKRSKFTYFTDPGWFGIINECDLNTPKNNKLHEITVITGPLKGSGVIWCPGGAEQLGYFGESGVWMLSNDALYLYGLHCGYPECCVDEYVNNGRRASDIWNEYSKDFMCGIDYVPCKKCCEGMSIDAEVGE